MPCQKNWPPHRRGSGRGGAKTTYEAVKTMQERLEDESVSFVEDPEFHKVDGWKLDLASPVVGVDHRTKRCKLQLKSIVDNKQGDHEASLEEIWSKVGKCRNLISCIQMIQSVANGVAKAPVHFPVLNTLPSHDGWKTTHYFPAEFL